MLVRSQNEKDKEIAKLTSELKEADLRITHLKEKAGDALRDHGRESKEYKSAAKALSSASETQDYRNKRLIEARQSFTSEEFAALKQHQPQKFACWQAIANTRIHPAQLDLIIDTVNSNIPQEKLDAIFNQVKNNLPVSADDQKHLEIFVQVSKPLQAYGVEWEKKRQDVCSRRGFNAATPANFVEQWAEKYFISISMLESELKPLQTHGFISKAQSNLIKKEFVERNMQELFAVLRDHKIYPTSKEGFAALKKQMIRVFPEHEKQIKKGKLQSTEKDIVLITMMSEIEKEKKLLAQNAQNKTIAMLVNRVKNFLGIKSSSPTTSHTPRDDQQAGRDNSVRRP